MKYIIAFLLICSYSFAFSQVVDQPESSDSIFVEKPKKKKIKYRDKKLQAFQYCENYFTLADKSLHQLDRASYVMASPYVKKIFNTETDFVVFKLGQRKNSHPFVFVNVFVNNACLNRDSILEIQLENGEFYRLKNSYKANCNGYFISDLKKGLIKKMLKSEIKSMMIYSFMDDLEFYFTKEEAERFHEELSCLNRSAIQF